MVLATGALQQPRVPACAAQLPASVTQVLAPDYRNPQNCRRELSSRWQRGVGLPDRRRVGARRASGLPCVEQRWWLPRRYRGQDIGFWFRSLGWFKRTVDDLPPGARTGNRIPN